jgi:TldD protein
MSRLSEPPPSATSAAHPTGTGGVRVPYSRRAFLSTASLAVAGLAIGARRLSAAELATGIAPSALLPDPVDVTMLQSLAMHAIDAAKSAGATYADIRVAASQYFVVGKAPGGPLEFWAGADVLFGFGVRVLVNGGWGFVHGDVPSIDAVTTAARGAVTQATNAAKAGTARAEYVPAAVATGEWHVPMAIDPFAVPLHEQMALIRSWMDTAGAVWRVGSVPYLSWHRETRVFASTDGSLTTQHFHRANPQLEISGGRMMGGGGPNASVGLAVPSVYATAGGYETVARESIHEEIKATAEEVRRLATLEGRTFDVGRYPVVLDGATFGALLFSTVGRALELDRVLGDEADASGTSYLSPPTAKLGTPVFSSALTLSTDRALPSVTSVKWDDEGVEPVAGPLITAGQLVDYETSRQTVGALQPWYQQQNRPLASRGRAVAPAADNPVQIRCGHLTVAPSTSAATIDDLIRDMPRGLVVRSGYWISTDQQLSTGNVNSYYALVLEVQKGRIVRRIKDAALEWSTVPFLKQLLAVGDASTVVHATGESYKGVPWHAAEYHTTAPAALFKEVNLIDIGRPI